MKQRLIRWTLLLTMAAATGLGGCRANDGLIKGKKQPRKGPMPCPVKDC
ncbi:MAG: hypothetical protein WBA12_02430 [Catalinimonas sp.]